MKNRYTVGSIARFRAPAAEQRRRGLKVGGTATEFQIIDNETGDKARIVAYGPTPGDRKTAALEQFRQMQANGDPRIIAFADQAPSAKPRAAVATPEDGIDAVEDRAHKRAMSDAVGYAHGPDRADFERQTKVYPCHGCGHPHGGPDCAVF